MSNRASPHRNPLGELHGTLRQLTNHAHRTVSRELRLAGSELVLAISDLVLDGTVVADPATIADRIDLSRAVSNLAGAIDARTKCPCSSWMRRLICEAVPTTTQPR